MSNVETYYECGFTVDGAHPVTVNQYCRNEVEATKTAVSAAEAHVEHARILGINLAVSVWVERWTTQRVEKRYKRQEVGRIELASIDREETQRRYERSVEKSKASA